MAVFQLDSNGSLFTIKKKKKKKPIRSKSVPSQSLTPSSAKKSIDTNPNLSHFHHGQYLGRKLNLVYVFSHFNYCIYDKLTCSVCVS